MIVNKQGRWLYAPRFNQFLVKIGKKFQKNNINGAKQRKTQKKFFYLPFLLKEQNPNPEILDSLHLQ